MRSSSFRTLSVSRINIGACPLLRDPASPLLNTPLPLGFATAKQFMSHLRFCSN